MPVKTISRQPETEASNPKIHIREPKSRPEEPEEIQRRVRQSLAAPPPSFSERVIEPSSRSSQQPRSRK